MAQSSIVKTIKKVMPAVVSIMIAKHLADVEKEIPPEMWALMPHDGTDKHPKLSEDLADKDGMVEIGGGSGFIVSPEGIIVTNKHVVSESNAEYTVVTNDGVRHGAHVLTRDPLNDVAILKIDGKKLPTVALGDTTKLELGEGVLAIGNALGMFQNTVSSGIVSGLSRAIRAQADPNSPPQEMRGLIQTDAAINPGNSGGPLVNFSGYAIGINSATVFGAQSIGFAIPINAVKRDLADLKKYGRIRRPFLGVRYLVIDSHLQKKMKLPVEYGALVLAEGPKDHGVVPGSPADKAGLKDGDIILTINGKQVTKDHPVQDFLEDAEVNDVLSLSVLRKNETLNLSLALAERK